MILTTAAERQTLLARSKSIAMVGASANHNRASYFVFSYVRTRRRFVLHPINPALTEIDGVTAYPTLAAFAEKHGPPDLVDVFRRPSELLALTREAIAVGAKAIWYQYDLIDDEAIALADAAELNVVVDHCLKVELARGDGGLSLGGMNSGLITAKRRAIAPVQRPT